MSDKINETDVKEKHIEENKMGVMSVNRLIINVALPMILSMLVQACYNIVDSIFVARITDAGRRALRVPQLL